ncbi:hypothetical protein COO91_04388 [Nostoc flagelliforme CCNUN1]|uniref:Uncharacterized protein n=1 Tax=Nostoc flagelliforme CCNUN1 TaxID=2038116 RepID=A0A2K8SSP3_9NOSO|nr:hypothetical protein COO91_04388 [Nostoc flagelliforme CCNUN1]
MGIGHGALGIRHWSIINSLSSPAPPAPCSLLPAPCLYSDGIFFYLEVPKGDRSLTGKVN